MARSKVRRRLFEDGMREVLSCTSKARYETYWQARYAAREQEARTPGLRLGLYECEYCGGWHLTSAAV